MPRTPKPKLARADHHGQSLHNRELAEIEQLAEAPQQNQGESFIDELERKTPEREREHAAYLARVAEWEAAHPNRFAHVGVSEHVSSSDMEKPERERPRVEPRLPKNPTPEIFIVRSV